MAEPPQSIAPWLAGTTVASLPGQVGGVGTKGGGGNAPLPSFLIQLSLGNLLRWLDKVLDHPTRGAILGDDLPPDVRFAFFWPTIDGQGVAGLKDCNRVP